MELVHHQKELVGGVGFQPFARLVERARLDAPHQHDVQHVVVGYENVGRRGLHVPARPHFAAVYVGEVVARIRRQAVVRAHRGALALYRVHVGAKVAEPVFRAGSARSRRLPGVPPESHAVARSVGVHPRERAVRIERLAQAPELVFDEGVQRIHYQRANGVKTRRASARMRPLAAPSRAVVLPPLSVGGRRGAAGPPGGLARELREYGQKKALRLARTRAGGHDEVFAVRKRGFQALPLVPPELDVRVVPQLFGEFRHVGVLGRQLVGGVRQRQPGRRIDGRRLQQRRLAEYVGAVVQRAPLLDHVRIAQREGAVYVLPIYVRQARVSANQVMHRFSPSGLRSVCRKASRRG